jgi:hypothetical protein
MRSQQGAFFGQNSSAGVLQAPKRDPKGWFADGFLIGLSPAWWTCLIICVGALRLEFPALADWSSPYGVCAHVSRGDERPMAAQEFQLMRNAGIVWVRTDFDWSGVERSRGKWTFNHLDEVVELAEKAEICILPILDYDVPWARPAYKHLDLWLEYVRQVVSRYKDRLHYWEVWNEPNLENFWRDKPDPANYVQLLRATYQEIKRIDPKLTVLLGGMAGIPWTYLEGIYKAGGKDYFDVMNVHPYRYPRGPEESQLLADLLRLRNLMKEFGDDDKPIWITEIGWPTHQGPRGISEEAQAQILPRSYLLALEGGVARIFWYEFQAPERQADYNEDHFGIVHRDLTPKPAYQAYKTLCGMRPPGSTRLGFWQDREVVASGWVTLQGESVWAVWAPKEEKDVRFSVSGEVKKVITHLGVPMEKTLDRGLLHLRIGLGPIYVVGPKILKLAE